ncbi:poliovirus receptor-like isoform X1 [Saccopteryx leptura]|uniref:poliovirus receptor-like isoform X1 n=1 Tax=Saccopteryx leptura TaxID=249018 RepID=UPI00339BEF1F
MARAGTFGPSLLLLSLLLLSWPPAGAEIAAFQVEVQPLVRGFLGEDATLLCKLQLQEHDVRVTLVTWQQQDPAGVPRSVAVFHPTQGASYPADPSFPEHRKLEFVAARPGEKLRDLSLAVRGLRAEDEANYTCHIATFPHGSKSASTWLRVLAKPQNKAETQEVLLSPLDQEPVPVACCVSMGGRPPARISWSLDAKANNSQEPGPLPGTFTTTSLLTLIPSSQVDGKNVTCTVEHESFEKPVLLSVTLTVPYPPEVSISGYKDNWYLGRSEALKCHFRSNPEPTSYDWNTTLGPLPPSAVAQGTNLLVHSVDKSVNTTFICHVTNAVGTGKAEQTILVKEEPPKGLSPGILALIIILAVVSVVVVGAMLCKWWYKRFRQNQHNSVANSRGPVMERMDVSYSTVNCEASSP